jgi:hypothetical protein
MKVRRSAAARRASRGSVSRFEGRSKRQKVAPPEIWEKHVRGFFGSHSWIAQVGEMRCSVCGAIVWRSPHAPFFKVIAGVHDIGWSNEPIENCNDMLVKRIQES